MQLFSYSISVRSFFSYVHYLLDMKGEQINKVKCRFNFWQFPQKLMITPCLVEGEPEHSPKIQILNIQSFWVHSLRAHSFRVHSLRVHSLTYLIMGLTFFICS